MLRTSGHTWEMRVSLRPFAQVPCCWGDARGRMGREDDCRCRNKNEEQCKKGTNSNPSLSKEAGNRGMERRKRAAGAHHQPVLK